LPEPDASLPAMDLEHCRKALERAGVVFAPGLTDAEVAAAEGRHGFVFPPDLRAWLQHALPVGERFPNWRLPDDPYIASALALPLDDMCFDISHNAFWPAAWGSRPPDLDDAFAIARRHVEAAPKLVPLRGHRYLPAEPALAGNPVFSVHQTDIILYGADLEDYLRNEYAYWFGTTPFAERREPRRIAFWSWLVDLNNGVGDTSP
jgi:hypothetical protein